MLAVDDLQWCDRPSLRFLAYLARRIEGLPVLVAATVRTGEAGTDAALMADDRRRTRRPSTIRPGPLSRPARGAGRRAAWAPTPSTAFVAACHRTTGGNPLLLRQLLTRARAERVAPRRRRTRASSRRSARARSRAACCCGWRACPRSDRRRPRGRRPRRERRRCRTVAALTELDDTQAAAAIATLARAEILRAGGAAGLRPPARARRGLPASCRRGERELAARPRRAGAATTPAPTRQVATHLLPRRARRAGVIEASARPPTPRVRRGATEDAVAYLQRALEEPPAPDAERPELLLELGLVESLTSGPAASEHLSEAYATLADPRPGGAPRARSPGCCSSPARRASCPPSRAPRCGAPGRRQRRPLRARGLHHQRVAVGGSRQAELEVLRRYRERRAGTSRSALGEAPRGRADGAYVGPRRRRPSRAWRGPAPLGDGELFASTTASSPSRPASRWRSPTARRRLPGGSVALADAHRRGSLYSISALNAWRGCDAVHLRASSTTPRRCSATAYDGVRLLGHAVGAGLYIAGFLAAHLRRARPAGRGAAPSSSRTPPMRSDGAGRHGRARQSCCWPRAATTEAVERSRSSARLHAPRDAATRRPVALDCGAGRSTGSAGPTRRSRSPRRSSRGRARFGAPGPSARAARARAAAGRGGLAPLEEAVAVSTARRRSSSTPRRWPRWAPRCAATGGRRTPREPLRRALELAEACGAAGLVEHVRAELYATGARPRTTALAGVDALTASERRVAALAAEGQSNRDIAQALFVTPKTVEVHLSNAYRKLGIRSRRELAGALGQ